MGVKMQIPSYADDPIYTWSCEALSGGMNLADLEFKLSDNQSPNVLNMWYRNRSLCKRFGQDWFSVSLNGEVFAVNRTLYKDKFIIHAGNNLFSVSHDGKVITEIFSGLSAQGGSFLTFSGKLYYRNGAEYVFYDGSVCKAVEPTIPNVVINRTPDGTSGSVTDAYNLFGAGFSNTFNGDGASVTYYLTEKNLDLTAVKALVGTTEISEGSGFSVNRTLGTVTFNTAPIKGQNNVKITAFKSSSDERSKILGCKCAATYGGQNNSRVVIGGNGSSTIFISEVMDPAYFPADNDFTLSGNGNVTGFGEQYDILVVFLERAIYGLSYEFADSKGRFSTVCINPNIGCDMPKTIELIENRLVWCNSYGGVHILVSTQIENERNVQPISRNINGSVLRPGLLTESQLQNAFTVDFENRYWLCVNGKAYIWDYSIAPYMFTGSTDSDAARLSWWKFDNIRGVGFLSDDGRLFIVRDGRIIIFKNDFKDFGQGFRSVYQMPLRDFGMQNYLKTVIECWITVRSDTSSRIQIKYITENEPNGEQDSDDILVPGRLWKGFQWNSFQWLVINFAKSFRRKPNKKKIFLFGILLESNELGRDMDISALTLTWRRAKKIKS